MNRSSIYTIQADQQPEWAEGVPAFGWVYATKPHLPLPADETFPFARHVIHCAPGTEPPANVVQVVVRGHETPWIPEAIAAAWPNGHKYVMEATWQETDSVEAAYVRRGKIIEVPEGVTPIETGLVPHEWAGDGAQ